MQTYTFPCKHQRSWFGTPPPALRQCLPDGLQSDPSLQRLPENILRALEEDHATKRWLVTLSSGWRWPWCVMWRGKFADDFDVYPTIYTYLFVCVIKQELACQVYHMIFPRFLQVNGILRENMWHYVSSNMYIYIYIYTYVSHAHMCVYIYIHTHTHICVLWGFPVNLPLETILGVAFWMATVSIRENGERFTTAREWDLLGTDWALPPFHGDTSQQLNLMFAKQCHKPPR